MKHLLTASISLMVTLTATGLALDHGQGEMAGRVTENSVILQSRLTKGNTLINGDLPGCPGVARFELATNPEFKNSRKTRWIEALPEYDYIVKVKVADLA